MDEPLENRNLQSLAPLEAPRAVKRRAAGVAAGGGDRAERARSGSAT